MANSNLEGTSAAPEKLDHRTEHQPNSHLNLSASLQDFHPDMRGSDTATGHLQSRDGKDFELVSAHDQRTGAESGATEEGQSPGDRQKQESCPRQRGERDHGGRDHAGRDHGERDHGGRDHGGQERSAGATPAGEAATSTLPGGEVAALPPASPEVVSTPAAGTKPEVPIVNPDNVTVAEGQTPVVPVEATPPAPTQTYPSLTSAENQDQTLNQAVNDANAALTPTGSSALQNYLANSSYINGNANSDITGMALALNGAGLSQPDQAALSTVLGQDMPGASALANLQNTDATLASTVQNLGSTMSPTDYNSLLNNVGTNFAGSASGGAPGGETDTQLLGNALNTLGTNLSAQDQSALAAAVVKTAGQSDSAIASAMSDASSAISTARYNALQQSLASNTNLTGNVSSDATAMQQAAAAANLNTTDQQALNGVLQKDMPSAFASTGATGDNQPVTTTTTQTGDNQPVTTTTTQPANSVTGSPTLSQDSTVEQSITAAAAGNFDGTTAFPNQYGASYADEMQFLNNEDPQLITVLNQMQTDGMSESGLQTVVNGLYSKLWGHDYNGGGQYTSPIYTDSAGPNNGGPGTGVLPALMYEFNTNPTGPEGTISSSDMNIYNQAVSEIIPVPGGANDMAINTSYTNL